MFVNPRFTKEALTGGEICFASEFQSIDISASNGLNAKEHTRALEGSLPQGSRPGPSSPSGQNKSTFFKSS